MKIAVLLKEVVDLVEELSVLSDGSDIDRSYLTYRSNEFDDFALGEALALKDEANANVDVFALDGTEVNRLLHMAAARGADRLVKIKLNWDLEKGLSTRLVAQAYVNAIRAGGYDLILTGVQGVDDLDGPISGYIASLLGIPNISVIVKIVPSDPGKVSVFKEFPAGVLAEYEVTLPAICGVQAARDPPPYIPVSKLRRAAKSATIEEIEVTVDEEPKVSPITAYTVPEAGERAEMIVGSLDEQVTKLVEILQLKGLL